MNDSKPFGIDVNGVCALSHTSRKCTDPRLFSCFVDRRGPVHFLPCICVCFSNGIIKKAA